MDLRFTGDIGPGLGLGLAAAMAVATWWLYRKEARAGTLSPAMGWLLPSIRTVAVLLFALMLIEPVLHFRQTVGRVSRVLLFVDASSSMSINDRQMEDSRRLRILDRMGLLPSDTLDDALVQAIDEVSSLRRKASADAASVSRDIDLRESALAVRAAAEKIHDHLQQLRPERVAVPPTSPGALSVETWTQVPGSTLDDLRRSRDFPDRPSSTSRIASFEIPANRADNYGLRIRGFLLPPATGDYTFWITSDDQSELWLSDSDHPAAIRRIAGVSTFAAERNWDQFPEQKSRPVRLEQGRRYYVEVLYKEGTGGDHLAVAWQRPDGGRDRPIPPACIAPFDPAATTSPVEQRARLVADFRQQVLDPAGRLVELRDDPQQTGLRAGLETIAAAAAAWHERLERSLDDQSRDLVAAGQPPIAQALARFDALTRWQRTQDILLTGDPGVDPLIEQLQSRHHVELWALAGDEAQRLWWPGQAIPAALPLTPVAQRTNLVEHLRRQVESASNPEERLAIVLMSDGRHNQGPSPLQAAREWGARGVPVYSVGVGSAVRPTDLAVVRVTAPESVFHKDRVRGQVILADDMPPGLPFSVRIEHNGKTLWEKTLQTDRTHLRPIDFDFALEQVVAEELRELDKDLRYASLPLSLQAFVTALPGELSDQNNSSGATLRAVTGLKRALLIEGRPRWEFRYLRNLFERDPQWEVTALVAGVNEVGKPWPRGKGPNAFPADREALLAYDIIVLGEVPRGMMKEEELGWLADFVEKRGGGLIAIDGRRGLLRSYADTPIAAMLPVKWRSPAAVVPGIAPKMPQRMRLTDAGARLAPLALAAEEAENRRLWESLRPPHWTADVEALPGAEVLLEAMYENQPQPTPALVTRQFGAGRVVYAGFDESWRWRHGVADVRHGRYWSQLAQWVMEEPYAVRDKFVLLDAGGGTLDPGASATLRVRLRDQQGRPMLQANAQAVLWRDNKQVAVLPLTPDVSGGGVFRTDTPALEGGEYEVRVRVEGLPEAEMKARLPLSVRHVAVGEMADLNADEDLLRKIADLSGGEYFREESIAAMSARLASRSQSQVIESETSLWDNWWLFAPIMGLLTVEWILRKRAGVL